MYRQHYAREGAGMANANLGHISGKETLITWIAVNAVKIFLSRRLNGLTGDTLGAIGGDWRNDLPSVAFVGLMYAYFSGSARSNNR